jgi:hypothetical protein
MTQQLVSDDKEMAVVREYLCIPIVRCFFFFVSFFLSSFCYCCYKTEPYLWMDASLLSIPKGKKKNWQIAAKVLMMWEVREM